MTHALNYEEIRYGTMSKAGVSFGVLNTRDNDRGRMKLCNVSFFV